MVIEFRCSTCQSTLHAPGEYAGGSARCEHCSAQVRVPDPGTTETQPKESAEDHTIEVACPSCKKLFGVELGELAMDKNLLVACDHCGAQKKLGSFQNEMARQLRLAEDREGRAAVERAKRQSESQRERQRAHDHEQMQSSMERLREEQNQCLDPHGRTQVPPNRIAPQYSAIRTIATVYRVLGILTIGSGLLMMLMSLDNGSAARAVIRFFPGLITAISGVLLIGFGEILAAFRDIAINSFLAAHKASS